MSLQNWFDSMEDGAYLHDSFQLSWSAKGVGFGQFYFYFNDMDEKIHISNECMSKEFIKTILCKMIDEAILDDPRD